MRLVVMLVFWCSRGDCAGHIPKPDDAGSSDSEDSLISDDEQASSERLPEHFRSRPGRTWRCSALMQSHVENIRQSLDSQGAQAPCFSVGSRKKTWKVPPPDPLTRANLNMNDFFVKGYWCWVPEIFSPAVVMGMPCPACASTNTKAERWIQVRILLYLIVISDYNTKMYDQKGPRRVITETDVIYLDCKQYRCQNRGCGRRFRGTNLKSISRY